MMFMEQHRSAVVLLAVVTAAVAAVAVVVALHTSATKAPITGLLMALLALTE